MEERRGLGRAGAATEGGEQLQCFDRKNAERLAAENSFYKTRGSASYHIADTMDHSALARKYLKAALKVKRMTIKHT